MHSVKMYITLIDCRDKYIICSIYVSENQTENFTYTLSQQQTTGPMQYQKTLGSFMYVYAVHFV